MSVGVAIIGSGVFVREKHLPAVQEAPSLTLKALFSRSLKSAQALGSDLSGVDLYSEDAGEGKAFSDLLARSDIKGVIMALPIPAQPEYIKAALSAGKHVLSEKPIAKDVATARELLDWYNKNIDKSKVTWGVAENFRFFESYRYGAEKVKELGKVLGFSTKVHVFVKEGSKYHATSWRTKPSYQGGFLLDGGVHFIAATRVLLSDSAHATSVSAFTALHQEHLPPVDTVDAIWKLSNGSSGTFSNSFAAPVPVTEYRVVCERGTVTTGFGTVPFAPAYVTVKRADADDEEKKEFPEVGFGVNPEVAAWGQKLEKGGFDERQLPEEALKDLEILEAMLKSGEQGGAPVTLQV
ncbi:oxidoreductase NAD-binding rossmann fold protein [Neofusicoccum parvum]|uniref:Oxidoreductase NAD-binding rossmann fold protein n=1 Tax=Neofusicoccum parvum TaxID=310453 RepID=A0ACB5S7K8_9PEZI|nr:oxidoreductase NAD-binding rossmann fold protein [Neofusicoccum parvum]GME44153.1 oxidoreductase NAD-binding rossmann fold protein [Neofusicoccum parvum]